MRTRETRYAGPRAVRARVEVDPDYDKAHYHPIGARAALHESEGPVASYEQRLAENLQCARAPPLAHAYLHAGVREGAPRQRPLELAPDDVVLLRARGEAKAWLGDPTARRRLAPRGATRPEDMALASSAFLLEREAPLPRPPRRGARSSSGPRPAGHA
jgi:hypothetical protein